jgi:hypothetical protein
LEEKMSTHAPAPKSTPHGLNVLVIGDSNTEIGHITGGLARLFEQDYGYFGSGYHSLNRIVGMGEGYLPYLNIDNVGDWESYTMLWPVAAEKPYLAPDGACVRGSTPGAHTDVSFYGTGVDLFWLREPGGGEFDVIVDGVPKSQVSTKGSVIQVSRTCVGGLDPGWHRLQADVRTGTVTLEGADARVDLPEVSGRAVVHKWGKGWAATADFLDVDRGVFSSAMSLVAPDITVILLGSNDHNLHGVSADQFAANMTEIVARVRSACPRTKILLVSTFMIVSDPSNAILMEYVKVFPDTARANHAFYWDMCSWFGPFESTNGRGWFMDGVHASEAGGAQIATQLYQEIIRIAALEARIEVPL